MYSLTCMNGALATTEPSPSGSSLFTSSGFLLSAPPSRFTLEAQIVQHFRRAILSDSGGSFLIEVVISLDHIAPCVLKVFVDRKTICICLDFLKFGGNNILKCSQ